MHCWFLWWFSTIPAISWMKFIGVGGCEWGGVGGKPKASNTIHKEANSSAPFSVGHRNCHS